MTMLLLHMVKQVLDGVDIIFNYTSFRLLLYGLFLH